MWKPINKTHTTLLTILSYAAPTPLTLQSTPTDARTGKCIAKTI